MKPSSSFNKTIWISTVFTKWIYSLIIIIPYFCLIKLLPFIPKSIFTFFLIVSLLIYYILLGIEKIRIQNGILIFSQCLGLVKISYDISKINQIKYIATYSVDTGSVFNMYPIIQERRWEVILEGVSLVNTHLFMSKNITRKVFEELSKTNDFKDFTLANYQGGRSTCTLTKNNYEFKTSDTFDSKSLSDF